MHTPFPFAPHFLKWGHLRLLLATGLLLLSTTSFAQLVAPALGAASSFALFTAVGAFNNVGPSTVQGNIGTNAGAFSGFPDGVVLNGSMHIADALATQAATDVETAYASAAGILNAVPLAVYGGTPPQTLAPGAYVVGAASTLAGSLILDGGGDPNAIFFLRVSGALTVAAGATVTLVNGAQVNNVYWQVGGLLILGQNSVTRGTFLVNGGINLIQGATLLGRVLSREGAINMDTNNVVGPRNASPLPVTLVSFSATPQNGNALMRWTTASEQNSRHFTVERSSTGTTGWKTVATVPAAGTSLSTKSYRVVDADVRSGLRYYRLRSTDLDGTFSFSAVRSILLSDATQAAVFPNPVQQDVTVTGVQPGSLLTLMDLAGRIRQRQVAGGTGTEHVHLNELLAGSYLLNVVSPAGTATALKVQKQ